MKQIKKVNRSLTINTAATLEAEPELDLQVEGSLTPHHEVVTVNVSPKVRYDKMAGRDYLVVPMVMITEGVHAGSNGPLYYPADELGKTPAVWNAKPVVVYHPEDETGDAVSACIPEQITKRSIGVIMNSVYEAGRAGKPGRLKAEAWMETNRLIAVDQRVINTIKKGKMMEVSTGLFTDNEAKPGVFKGKAYSEIARNYRPDHLAILPDQTGACSVADGAGLLRNSTMSHDEIRSKLQDAVRDKTKPLGTTANSDYPRAWVNDVFDGFCVYRHGDKMFKHDYTTTNGSVALSGKPVEVMRSQTYKTADGTVINTRGKAMTKEQKIASLIANKGTRFEAADEEFLTSLTDDQLDKLTPVANTTGKGKPATPAIVDEDDVTAVAAAPATNAAKGKLTAEEWFAAAPAGFREQFEEGQMVRNSAKAKLVKGILANKRNRFTEDMLKAMPLGQLQAIGAMAIEAAAAAAAPVANYGGWGEIEQPELVENAIGDDDDEPLTSPTLEFKLSD